MKLKFFLLMLVSAPLARADIHYVDTPSWQMFAGVPSPYEQIDLNADGQYDIGFQGLSIVAGNEGYYEWLIYGPTGMSKIAEQAVPGDAFQATRLFLGAWIGPPVDASRWTAETVGLAGASYTLEPSSTEFSGSWPNQRGFFGFRFLAGDGEHFAWIDLENAGGHTLTIHGFAHEQDAGIPILAGAVPEPGPGLLMLLGALLLHLRRLKS